MTSSMSIAELQASAGQVIGTSSWYDVTQDRIQAFADATEDWNPIHVDPAAAARTPTGTVIAHGLFTLALGPKFQYEILEVTGTGLQLNYGYDKVRWLSPVPVGSRVRMTMELVDSEPVDQGIKFRTRETFEIEGQDKPACLAEHLFACYYEKDS